MTLFDLLGGEVGVRRLVDRFYDHMDQDPGVAPLRALHPPDLAESREKLWMFLVGWTGGPPLYMMRRGHPRLRARHLPFPVDGAAAAQWMACMRAAMDDCAVPAAAREVMEPALARLADHMRNVDAPTAG